ncbi:MAG: hypothetical protein JWM77_1363 [Rhodospirillales bacterium]|nr:hypothetical protein [Rhodospirillales bacterium]
MHRRTFIASALALSMPTRGLKAAEVPRSIRWGNGTGWQDAAKDSYGELVDNRGEAPEPAWPRSLRTAELGTGPTSGADPSLGTDPNARFTIARATDQIETQTVGRGGSYPTISTALAAHPPAGSPRLRLRLLSDIVDCFVTGEPSGPVWEHLEIVGEGDIPPKIQPPKLAWDYNKGDRWSPGYQAQLGATLGVRLPNWAESKAIIYHTGRTLYLENVHLDGGAQYGDGAALRVHRAAARLGMNKCRVSRSADGVFSENTNCRMEFRECDLSNNGWNQAGRNHNVYIQCETGQTGSAAFWNCRSTHSHGGHALKVKLPKCSVFGGVWAADREGVGMDFPAGGTIVVAAADIVRRYSEYLTAAPNNWTTLEAKLEQHQLTLVQLAAEAGAYDQKYKATKPDHGGASLLIGCRFRNLLPAEGGRQRPVRIVHAGQGRPGPIRLQDNEWIGAHAEQGARPELIVRV